MRIGYFVHSFHPHVGGIESFVLGHARLARDLGHEAHVLCPLRGDRPQEEDFEGILVHRFPEIRKRWPGLPHAVTRGMGAAARRLDLNLLHAYEYRNGPPLVAGRLRRDLGIPMVWSTAFHPAHRSARQEHLRGLYDATLGRQMVRSTDVVAYLSRLELDTLIHTHRLVAAKPTVFLPPVIRVAGLQALARLGRLAPDAPGPLPRPYLVVLGRMERYKGARELVDGLALTRSEAHLVFIGALSKTERSDLMGHATQRGVSGRVHALGGISEAAKCAVLSEADGFVNASNYESFGIALVEALALGVPSLSTTTGIAPEVLGSDQTLKSLDAEYIALNMDALLAQGKAGLQQATPGQVDARFGPDAVRLALQKAYALAETTARS